MAIDMTDDKNALDEVPQFPTALFLIGSRNRNVTNGVNEDHILNSRNDSNER